MDLQDILKQWEQDCHIGNDLAEASRDTPKLHAKYMQLLSVAKLQLQRAENAQKVLLKDKWMHYNGKLDEESIKDKGWDPDPLNGLHVLKGDMDRFYDADKELQKSEDKIQYLKTTIDTLKEIVENLKWRHQTIGNMIKWRQFEAGS